MLEDIKIKNTSGKTKYIGRFENISAMAEHFKKDLTGANLTGANLTGANLTEANLTEANLTGANLTGANLTEANLTGAKLTGANLTGANLTEANLTGAKLTGADLTIANLTGAKLTGADIDFSTWPLWCGSFKVIVDRKQKIQLLEHALRLIEYNQGDEDLKQILELDFVKKARFEFHHK